MLKFWKKLAQIQKKTLNTFYLKLSEFNDVDLNDDNFYDNCSKLSQELRDQMKAESSEMDLLAALNTSTDSRSGPDGITYSEYKKLRIIVGPIILNFVQKQF